VFNTIGPHPSTAPLKVEKKTLGQASISSFFNHRATINEDIGMITPESIKNVYTSYAVQRKNVWNGNPMRTSLSRNDESSVSPSPEHHNSILVPASSTSKCCMHKESRETKESFPT
jgi:hypothetical protein